MSQDKGKSRLMSPNMFDALTVQEGWSDTSPLQPPFTPKKPEVQLPSLECTSQAMPIFSKQSPVTPKARPMSRTSAASRRSSPTPLPQISPSTEWVFNGEMYDNLDDVINASGKQFGIHESLVDWMTTVVREISRRSSEEVYNECAAQISRHKESIFRDINDMEERISKAENNVENLTEVLEGMQNAIQEVKTQQDDRSYVEALGKSFSTMDKDIGILNSNQHQVADKLQEINGVLHENRHTIIKLQQELAGFMSNNRPVTPPSIRMTSPLLAPRPQAPMPPLFPPGISGFQQVPANTYTAPAPAVSAPMRASLPKIAEPPKFKGKSDLSLEQWLQKMSLWFSWYGIIDDQQKILMGLSYLEGTPADFMNTFAMAVSAGNIPGTWQNFVTQLETGYRQLAPEKTSQQALSDLDKKKFSSMSDFAEKFRTHAVKSQYSNTDLIARIENHWSSTLRNIMVAMFATNPMQKPTTWEAYLDLCLRLEMNIRDQKTDQPASGTASNPVVVNAVSGERPKPLELNDEQMEWLKKGLCIRCGKHRRPTPPQRCGKPKYPGYFRIPPNVAPKKEIRTAETSSVEATTSSPPPMTDRERLAQLETTIKAQQAKLQALQKPPPPPVTTTARIVEIEDPTTAEELDFIMGTL